MRLKRELYKKEQLYLSNKIIDILELDEKNQIILYHLDNNIEKQNNIIKLIPELRKYFSFRNMRGYMFYVTSSIKHHKTLFLCS
jgi:hypothetical protein